MMHLRNFKFLTLSMKNNQLTKEMATNDGQINLIICKCIDNFKSEYLNHRATKICCHSEECPENLKFC